MFESVIAYSESLHYGRQTISLLLSSEVWVRIPGAEEEGRGRGECRQEIEPTLPPAWLSSALMVYAFGLLTQSISKILGS